MTSASIGFPATVTMGWEAAVLALPWGLPSIADILVHRREPPLWARCGRRLFDCSSRCY
jgi:hypothetical protein